MSITNIIQDAKFGISEFVKDNPIITGSAIGGVLTAGGIALATKVRSSGKKSKSVRKRKKTKVSRKKRTRRSHHSHKRNKRIGVHKSRIKHGLDIIHRGKKRGISLKAIRASIASPRTPPHLKKGLRKLLAKRSRHSH